MPTPLEPILQKIRAHAVRQLPTAARMKVNLHVDERVIPAGEMIGPKRQNITLKNESILVFADDLPMADFSHPCRYLLYDPKGNFTSEVKAQYPPYSAAKPTFKIFHEPVKIISGRIVVNPIRYHRCPILIPDGARYAILFSGMSNVRHLNNLEFLYRTLIDDYAIKPANIYVLNYDGTLKSQDGVAGNFVDGTPYQMHVTGQGSRAALEAAIDDVKGRLKANDLLFLYTSNHGGYDNIPGSADLCTYPNWDGYHAADLASKLGTLPHIRNLLVMMSQCHSGGFNTPICNASTADATSVAASVTEQESSYVTMDFNTFGKEWTSAQATCDPWGHPLAPSPDSDGDGAIESHEAFDYAYAHRPAGNDPVFTTKGAGSEIKLGQAYKAVSWWCPIIFKAVEKHILPLPPEEYYAHMHAIEPELTKLAAQLDVQSNKLQAEYAAKVEKAVAAAVERMIAQPV